MPNPELLSAASALKSAQNIVLKIGSSIIGGEATDGEPADLSALLCDSLSISTEKRGLAIVSSGAVALGRQRAPAFARTSRDRKALSAIGQIDLMTRWQNAARANDRTVAQVLLTPDTTTRRVRYLNARATLHTLLDGGIIPIINENDAVATDEFRYGDNDRLAAMTAGLVDADTLVLLTDIDGLYTGHPDKDLKAKHIPHLSYLDIAEIDQTEMSTSSTSGTGGMASKLAAAEMAASWGITVILADGRIPNPLNAVLNGTSRATVIEPAPEAVSGRRKWLGGLSPTGGVLVVGVDTAEALIDGSNLLPTDVVDTGGAFVEGDVVAVHDEAGGIIGFGLSKVKSDDIDNPDTTIILHKDDFVSEDARCLT